MNLPLKEKTKQLKDITNKALDICNDIKFEMMTSYQELLLNNIAIDLENVVRHVSDLHDKVD